MKVSFSVISGINGTMMSLFLFAAISPRHQQALLHVVR